MEDYSVTKTEIWAYLSKTADSSTILKVEEWRNSDQFDEQLFTEIESIYKITGKNKQLPISTTLAKERFFKAIEIEKTNSFNWKSILKYAAVLVFILTTSTVIFQNFSKNDKQILVQTTYGEQKQIDLPDGSTVWLNASSSLRYTEKYPRKIYLEGEAFFEVAKDKEHPFIVSTIDQLNVKALGTSFNVKSYTENNFTETILYTGKVEVTSDKYFKDKIIMLPEDKVTFSKVTHKVIKSKTEFMESLIAWREGKIQFKNKSFHEIAKDLSIQYNIQIHFENEKLSNSKFTGSFEALTPMDEILETLKLSKYFEYKQVDSLLWVIK